MEENYWVELPSMKYKRNGASCCIFEKVSQIFVFGGVNSTLGVLDSIERYLIDEEKWEVITLKLSTPLHDFVCHTIGKERVMILGKKIYD